MDVAADYLSGGEQQMVAVARAMSGNVRLLLLDAPFEGLAPALTLELELVIPLLLVGGQDGIGPLVFADLQLPTAEGVENVNS